MQSDLSASLLPIIFVVTYMSDVLYLLSILSEILYMLKIVYMQR